MFRLTREVRFAINFDKPNEPVQGINGFAGIPPLRGFGVYLSLEVTLSGELNPQSSYLRNIKEIDEVVRTVAIPRVQQIVRSGIAPPGAIVELYPLLKDRWPGATLDALKLHLSPFQSVSLLAREFPMIRLSQMFEFSASHRLHNPAMNDEQNRDTFGKCNNPHGHGHNYTLQVTISGAPTSVASITDLERIVDEAILDKFDHKNLNVEIPEFADLIPSVENIARVIYRTLKPRLPQLAAITVWETPKTWCEYSE